MINLCFYVQSRFKVFRFTHHLRRCRCSSSGSESSFRRAAKNKSFQPFENSVWKAAGCAHPIQNMSVLYLWKESNSVSPVSKIKKTGKKYLINRNREKHRGVGCNPGKKCHACKCQRLTPYITGIAWLRSSPNTQANKDNNKESNNANRRIAHCLTVMLFEALLKSQKKIRY